MPASQEQKVDFLLKKIGYSASKTGIAEDSSLTGSTKKAPFAEAIPSPLIVPKSSVWSDSGFIPTTPPTSNTTYVGIYTAANAYRMTFDNSVGAARRSFIARSTYGNQSASIDGDWIDTQFGADYIVKVYKGDPNSGGVSLQQAGGNAGTDGWFFDYSSGVLNFNGNNLPSGIGTDNVYILGYRYTGAKGLQPPAGIGTFRDLVVTNNFKVGGISTFSGRIDANEIIEGIAGQNKIPSLYANYSDLPNPGTYHGMFAHVHGTQKGYFAHAGGWYELVNKETTGTVGTGTERYNIGALDATSLRVTGITTLGSIGISTGRIIGPSVTYIDPATVGAAGTVVILGNLQVDGTQTTVNSSVMTVTDKNIEVAKGAANDAAADGAGITVDAGSNTDKTWQWLDATDSWTSSEHIRIPDDKVFGFASDTNTYMGRPAADSFGFTFGGTEFVRMGYVPSIQGGGIGINRTSIGARLHIQHDGSGSLRHMVKLANNGAGQGTGAQINMGASTADEQYSASIAGFYDNPGTSFIIKTAGTYANQSTVAERLRVQHDGNVGINSTSPKAKLDVNGSLNVSGISTFNDDVRFVGAAGTIFFDKSNNVLEFSDDTKLKLGSASNDLQIYHDSSDNNSYITNNQNGSHLYVRSWGTNKELYLQAKGGVIINTNETETALLAKENGVLELYYKNSRKLRTQQYGIEISGGLTVSGVSTFAGNIDANGDLDVDGHTELDNVNIVGVTTAAGHVLPSADSTYDLGSSSKQWRNLYADNIVSAPGFGFIGEDLTVRNFKATGISTFVSKNVHIGNSSSGSTGRLNFGSGNPLSIFYDSNTQDAKILKSGGSGNLDIQVSSGSVDIITGTTNTAAKFTTGSVQLYRSNSVKLETTSSGIEVTGLTDTDTLTTGNATFTGSVSAGSTTGIDGYYLKSTGIGVTWAVLPSSRTGLTTTATAGQTSFNFSYNVGFVDVFLNGVKLPSTEFTASNGSTIVLDDAAFANDTLEFISLNTVPVTSSGGAQNLTGLADVTISGTPVAGDTLQHNGSVFVNDYTVTSTKTSTSQASIHSLAVATYRSVEYTVQITEGTKYHVTKILAIHDGTNVTFNEYGTLTTHSSLATFALDVNSGNMRLLATPASSNSTVFKVKFNPIKV